MHRAILVKSCQQNADRRQAIEATWGLALMREGVRVLTCQGGQEKQPRFQNGNLRLLCDDDYSANSKKLREALAMLLTLGGPLDFVFVCDDDTFIHPDRWLKHQPEGEFECRLYRPQSPLDHKLNYGQPWANGGAGWYMSRQVCELYVKTVTRKCSWDDVLATQAAQKAGIPIVDRPDLYGDSRYDKSPIVAADNQLITCHPCEPPEMLKRWEVINASV